MERKQTMTAGIILAAGLGRRLGLGPKAFVSLEGETLLERALTRLESAQVASIVVVLPEGPCPIDLPQHVRVVRNPEPASGQLGSTTLAVRALGEAVDRALLYPVDHYALDDQDIAHLLSVHAPDDAARIIPEWKGRGGHPIILLKPALAMLRELSTVAGRTLNDVLADAGVAVRVQALRSAVRVNLNTRDDLPSGC